MVGAPGAAAIGGTTVIEDSRTLANVGGTGTNTAGSVDIGIASIATTSAIGAILITSTVVGAGGTTTNADYTLHDMKIRRGHTKVLEAVDISTQAKANAAITALDTAMASVNEQRASYGSYISRFEHAAQNLTNISQNMVASRSRIEDADYASETTELARTQIIQQAGTAMLAQANAAKSTVMTLLT